MSRIPEGWKASHKRMSQELLSMSLEKFCIYNQHPNQCPIEQDW